MKKIYSSPQTCVVKVQFNAIMLGTSPGTQLGNADPNDSSNTPKPEMEGDSDTADDMGARSFTFWDDWE